MAVAEGWKGSFYEGFEVGYAYQHPLGRTATTTGYNQRAEEVITFKRTILVYEHGQDPQTVTLNPGEDK